MASPEPEPSQSRARTLEPSGAPSRLRVLLVIVPLLVIAGVGAGLLSSLSARLQEAWTAPAAPANESEGSAPDRSAWDWLTSEPRGPGLTPSAPEAERRIRDEEPRAERPAADAGAIAALVAKGNVEEGARTFKMCAPCHSGEKGAPPRIGPTLWGIVGRPKTAMPDYAYSAALRAKGGVWSPEELAALLSDPRSYAPGTKMSFAGIRQPDHIASLIAYLATLTDAAQPR